MGWFSGLLQGWLGKYLQFFGLRGLADVTAIGGLLVDPNDIPSQELAVVRRTVLEYVDETCLPCFPFLRQLRVVPEKDLVLDETGLHNGEMFRLSQGFYNIINAGLS